MMHGFILRAKPQHLPWADHFAGFGSFAYGLGALEIALGVTVALIPSALQERRGSQ
jgi:hypothetical protein